MASIKPCNDENILFSVLRFNMSHRISFLFVIILLNFKQGLCDDPEYRGSFTTGCEGCKDVENKKFNADKMVLEYKESDQDGAGDMCIQGSLEVTEELDEGYMIGMSIEKETDAGAEPMFSVLMGICDCLKDKDAPWTPVFAAMGIESCPIVKGTYKVKDMTINLDCAAGVMTHENCGDYLATVTMSDPQKNVIACYTMGLSVEEK